VKYSAFSKTKLQIYVSNKYILSTTCSASGFNQGRARDGRKKTPENIS